MYTDSCFEVLHTFMDSMLLVPELIYTPEMT